MLRLTVVSREVWDLAGLERDQEQLWIGEGTARSLVATSPSGGLARRPLTALAIPGPDRVLTVLSQ